MRGIVEVEENIREVAEAWDLIDFDAIKSESSLTPSYEIY